jgi:hypothetical protein
VEGGRVNPQDFRGLSIMSTELSTTNALFNNITIFNLVLKRFGDRGRDLYNHNLMV